MPGRLFQMVLTSALAAALFACGASTTSEPITGPGESVAPASGQDAVDDDSDDSPGAEQRIYVDDVELEARLKLAIALNAEAEWRAAMEHLEVLREHWGGLWTVQLEYARALYRLNGELEEVRAALDDSIRLHPQNPRAHVMLGQLHEDRGAWEKAEPEYRKAIEIRRTNLDARVALARVLRRQERPDEAAEVLQELVTMRGATPRMMMLLASSLEDAGRLDEAEDVYRQVARSHVDELHGLTILYRFLRRTGRDAEAADIGRQIRAIEEARSDDRNLRPLRPSAR